MSKRVDKIKDIAKQRKSTERFMKTRMWLSTIISAIFPDRIKIPDNIGDNIYIGNNLTITKNNISNYILITEYDEPPIAFTSKLIKFVKQKVPGVTIDFIFKCSKVNIKHGDSGLEARRKSWLGVLERDNSSVYDKKRAARLLHSYDIFEEGNDMYRTINLIVIRSGDGRRLQSATQQTMRYLRKHGVKHKQVKSKLEELLSVTMLTAHKFIKSRKDIRTTLQTKQTLAEMLPNTQGTTDKKGAVLGINMNSKDLYVWDFKSKTTAKNIAIYSMSGFGKTFIGTYWLLDFFALDCCISIVDIKGNEFDSFQKAVGGVEVPCKPNATWYINTFYLDKKRVKGSELQYFKKQFDLSLKQLEIIVDANEDEANKVETILTRFLEAVYILRGVVSDNKNTYYLSEDINPLNFAKEFYQFTSPSLMEEYGDIVKTIQSRFNIYFDRSGAGSTMFLNDFKFSEIYDAEVIRYDFGLLNGLNDGDRISLRLRALYMEVINNEFSMSNKEKGLWTVQILEEAQLTNSQDLNLMPFYSKEFSLRRSQNRANVLMCNSVNSIKDNPDARPLIDNTSILVIGNVTNDTREYLIKEYSLEKHRELLEKISTKTEYENVFFIKDITNPKLQPTLIKAHVTKEVADGPIFKVMDTED